MKVSPISTASPFSIENIKDKAFNKFSENEIKVQKKEIFEESFLSSLKVYFIVVRAAIRLKKIGVKIQLYGTSSKLFDLSTRNRQSVKKFLYPMDYVEDDKNIQDEEKVNFPILHPKGKIIAIWSPLSIILLIYTATIMPFRLVFYDNDNDFWNAIELLVDCGFWIDLAINMLSSYYDENGTLVKDHKLIIKQYLKSWFLLDLLACLPIDEILNALEGFNENNIDSNKIQLVRLSKLPRIYSIIKIAKVFKIFRIISEKNTLFDYFDINSGIMRLISLLITVLLVVHLIGCFWFYEAKLDEFNPETWVFRLGYLDKDVFSLYLASIYYSITTLATVGYGDIHALTKIEIVTSIVMMLFGVGVYSMTIGILSSVLSSLDTKSINLQKKITIMHEFCNEIKLNSKLKESLRKTLEYNAQKNPFIWIENTNAFNELPIYLTYEIMMNVQNKVISEILFFKNCDDKYFVVKIVPLLKPLFLGRQEKVWNAKTNPDAIYFLITGRVNYVAEFPQNKSLIPLESLKEDNIRYFIFKSMVSSSYFGEIEIIFKRKRDFTVITEVDCEFFYLNRFDFEDIVMKEFPHIAQQMKILASKREKINRKTVSKVSHLLHDLSEEKSLLIHDINTNKMSQKAEISKKINSKRQSSVPIPAISEEKLSSSSNSFNSKNGENFLDEDNLKNEGMYESDSLKILNHSIEISKRELTDAVNESMVLERRIDSLEAKLSKIINCIENNIN